MEYQLNDLIGKIYKEGVEVAQKQAEDIVAKAKVQAEKILEEAYQRSQKIRQEAEKEVMRLEEASRATLYQGARDMLLGVEKQLCKLLDLVLKEKITEALDVKTTVKLIESVLPEFLKSHECARVLLSEEQIKSCEASLRQSLAQKIMDDKLEIKPFASLDKGFRLQDSQGLVSYDFSVSAICEVLSTYINPRFSFLLKQTQETSQ